MELSVIIVSYNAFDFLVKCLNSLQEFLPDNAEIIVFDNASVDTRIQDLPLKYPTIQFILNPENLGFAKGNNIGIAYAREHFAPDFIVAANSDIIFEQPDYCEKLIEIYDRRPYAILGADIVDASRTQHFNPVACERVYTIPYMRKQALMSDMKAWMYRMIRFFHLRKLVEGKQEQTTREVEGKSVAADNRMEEEMEGVLLHGCCMVFSQDFFAEFDGFWPDTFLYAEEEIIYDLAMKKNMRVLYAPDVTCMHKEAVTTKQIYRDFCDAKIFYFSNVAKSYWKFLKLMKEQS